MTRQEIKHAVQILVNEKFVQEKLEKNEVYLLHWCVPDGDDTIAASRTSIHLFKTLESVVEFLFTEAGLDNFDELRNNFQAGTSEGAYVWDIIVLEVEK